MFKNIFVAKLIVSFSEMKLASHFRILQKITTAYSQRQSRSPNCGVLYFRSEDPHHVTLITLEVLLASL